MFCWHKWKISTARCMRENVTPCCGKVVSTDYFTAYVKECTKCGKAVAWDEYEAGTLKGHKFTRAVDQNRRIIEEYHKEPAEKKAS